MSNFAGSNHSSPGNGVAQGPEQPMLFEVSWEAANKVGGIYTVLRSKAPVTVEEYGGRYCLIGPLSASAETEVEYIPPTTAAMANTIKAMTDQGVKVFYGRWLIDGYPKVVLFDIGSAYHRLNEWKKDLWENFQIPSPDSDKETNDAIVFGYLVAWFFGELVHQAPKSYVISHYHEWQVGIGLMLSMKRHLRVATIFTTHATLLGRYLCAGDVDFYNNLDLFNVDEEAGKRQIYHRYCIERGSAHMAHVFTTVSHITAFEAEHLLKKRADGILPNGLGVIKFSALHEFQNLHAENKAKIHDFVRGHFYGHFDFDLDNTVYFFTAGRYEYRNKGIDVFIEALHRLNQKMKQANTNATVVSFFIASAKTKSFNVDALKGQAVVKQLKATVEEVQKQIGIRVFEQASRGNMPTANTLLSQQEMVLLKRRIYAMRRDALPPVVTHNMEDDANDPILNHFRRVGMYNQSSDRVKVVFHPEFLSSNSPLFGLDYDDFVRGCHLGVFPSYYEPWGYTPAECTVMGVPSITTNLAGFGCYMQEKIENPSDYGIYVVDRRSKSVEDSIQQLADYMFKFTMLNRRQRITLRNRTERLSELLDWETMGAEYVKARKLALLRAFPEMFAFVDAQDFGQSDKKMERPMSVPPSPRMSPQPHDMPEDSDEDDGE